MVVRETVESHGVQCEDTDECFVSHQRSSHTTPQSGSHASGDFSKGEDRVGVHDRLTIRRYPTTEPLSKGDSQAFHFGSCITEDMLCLELVGACVVEIEDAKGARH